MSVHEIKKDIRGAEIPDQIREYLKTMEEYYPEGIAGCAIVVWGFDISFSRGTKMHKDSPIGQTLLPSFVAEVLRRDISTEIAQDVVKERLS